MERRIANAETSERVKLNKSLKKIQEQANELYTYFLVRWGSLKRGEPEYGGDYKVTFRMP